MLISSVTVIVRAEGAIYLNLFDTVLFNVCSVVIVDRCIFCVALLMNMIVLCVACLTVFGNCLGIVWQFF